MSQRQKDLSKLFVSPEETEIPEEAPINGEFPSWLKGTYIQTGPGLLDLPNFTLNNYLDGFAMLTRIQFDGKRAKLTKKYPQTESYKKALELGKPYFMEYGTTAKREGSKGGGLFSKILTTMTRDDMSDNCSASVYHLAGNLIASSATSFISKINFDTLCHEHRYDMKKYMGQNGYGVHPLIDEDGTMWNMGFSVLPTVKYNVLKIPNATSKTVEIETLLSKSSTIASLSPRWNGALSLNHSFGMTKNYIIFIEQPYVIKISRVLAATMKDYAVKDWLEWRGSEKNKFYIIEKTTGKIHATEYLSTESFFFLHFVNCYEEDNKVVVDIATSKTPSSAEAMNLNKLRNNMLDEVDTCIIERYVVPIVESIKSTTENINLLSHENTLLKTTAQAVRKGHSIMLTPELIFNRGADRAIINNRFIGKKYSFIYASGSFLSVTDPENSIMAHSICKINVDTKEKIMWTASENHFTSEPVFVSKEAEGDENDGVIVAAASSSEAFAKDFVVVIDGKSFKEIATAEFTNPIPGGLHSIFISEREACPTQ